MESADGLALGFYLLALLALGVASARSAGESVHSFALGDRRIPWWALGFVDLASRSAHDAAWVAALLVGAVVGLHVEYGMALAIALPAGIVFGRYRRRLELTSGPEFLQARYGAPGDASRPYVAVGTAIVGIIALGELLRVGGDALGSWSGWSPSLIRTVIVGGALCVAVPAGLPGVVYAGLLQGLLGIGARVALAVSAVAAVAFLPSPPPLQLPTSTAPSGLSFDDGLLAVSLLLGAFLAAGRLLGPFTVRDLAAETPEDAARARTLQAFVALGLRMAPVLLVAWAIASLGRPGPPIDALGAFAEAAIPLEQRSWIALGLSASFAAALGEGLVAFATSLWNDLLRPRAEGAGVALLRSCILALGTTALVWAELVDPSPFILAVLLGAAVATLPAAAMRWLWWRFNITGEITAWAVAPLLAFITLGALGPQRPGLASIVLLAGGAAIPAAAALLSAPARSDTLKRFHARVRPVGFWGPVSSRQRPEVAVHAADHALLDGASLGAGFLAVLGSIGLFVAILEKSWGLFAVSAAPAVVGFAVHTTASSRRRIPPKPSAARISHQPLPTNRRRRVFTSPFVMLPGGPVAPWPRDPVGFASSWGPHASETVLYAPVIRAREGDATYTSRDDHRSVHRAGVRWTHPVAVNGVHIRFLTDCVPLRARVGLRRRGAEDVEWIEVETPSIADWTVEFSGAVVSIIVEQAAGGGSRTRPGVLGIASLTPLFTRRPPLEVLLEGPDGEILPDLPVTIDGAARTALDTRGAHTIILEATPARQIAAFGFEVFRAGAEGSEAALSTWLTSLNAVDIDGRLVAVSRRGIDGTMSGLAAGTFRIVLRLSVSTLASRVRLPTPQETRFVVRRATLDPRPIAYPRRLPVGPWRPPRRGSREPLELSIPGSGSRLLLGPDGTLQWPVTGRPAHHFLVCMSVDGRPLALRDRGRDPRSGIVVDRGEVSEVRVLRSILPAGGSAPGVELRLVLSSTESVEASVVRVARARVDGVRRVGSEETPANPIRLPVGTSRRVSIWIPRDEDGLPALGGRPGADPEPALVSAAEAMLAGCPEFVLPEDWDELCRRLLVTNVGRIGVGGTPPGATRFGPSTAHGLWVLGLAAWGARDRALEIFQQGILGRRTPAPPAERWNAEPILRWVGLGAQHAARVAARVPHLERHAAGGWQAALDDATTALWRNQRRTFLDVLQSVEERLDPDVMLHMLEEPRPWRPADDRLNVDDWDPRPALAAAGVHLALLRHALVTDPPDASGDRGRRVRLLAGLPADFWGEPIRIEDARTHAGPVSVSVNPTPSGTVRVEIESPEDIHVEVVPPVGTPVVVPGGKNTLEF